MTTGLTVNGSKIQLWTTIPAHLIKQELQIGGNAYRAMRSTKLKEMYIVRYADDFRIFCRTESDAKRTKEAVTLWLKERLKLEISEKKTRIVNTEKHYSEFLGFKMKVQPKGNKKVVVSHIADKNLAHKKQALIERLNPKSCVNLQNSV